MSNFPLVSVIVPTYNRPELLHRALHSIDSQTYRNFEAIVVNDGGEDVSQVVAQFSKARYLAHPHNKGLPAARNTGLRAAKGAWIAYLDDDDWYYPYHISLLVDNTHQARFIYSNADYVDHRGMVKLYMDVDPDPGNILSHNITPVCCVIHDRMLAVEAGMFDENLPNHEDWDLWIRMSKIAEMYHIKETTCCIDRSRPSMQNDMEAMTRGMLHVKWRYRKPPEPIHYEGVAILPAKPKDAESVRPDPASDPDAGLGLPARDRVRKAGSGKREKRVRQSHGKA